MNQNFKHQPNFSQSQWSGNQQNTRPNNRPSGPRNNYRTRNSFGESNNQRPSFQDRESRNSFADRMDTRPNQENKGRTRNCQKHAAEFVNRICNHPNCILMGPICDSCALEDITHSNEHKNCLMEIDNYLETADEMFQKQKKYILDNNLVPKDLLVFLEMEEKRVTEYIEHTKKQKRIIEEHSSSLIKEFIALVQDKLTEIKTIFDLQLDTFCKNYKIISEKIRVFYQNTGVGVFSLNVGKERIPDFDKFMKEIKIQVATLNSIINQPNEMTRKKKHEEEILNEIRKSTDKIDIQSAHPIKLDAQRDEKPLMNTNLNFYSSYKNLMRDIQNSFETFSNSLTPVDRVEEFEENNFCNLEPSLLNSDFTIESTIYLDRLKENLNKPKSSYDKKFNNMVWAENYFHLDCKNKMILAFESGGPFFLYFLFKNITPFMVEDSINSSCESKQLNIDFMIPRNHASIITPTGRVFLAGGCDDHGPSDSFYELNFDEQTLVKRKSMVYKRFSHAICSIDSDQLMVAGGLSPEKRLLDTCEIYDIREEKWYNVARMNKPSEKFCMTVFGNNYVYKFGGSPECCVERYSKKMNRWELLNIDFPMDMGTLCECVQINQNQILIFGGPCDSQYFFVNITESESGLIETVSDTEPIKFKNPGDSLYLGFQKSVVTYNKRIYAYDTGKQRIISYSGNSGWKISEGL